MNLLLITNLFPTPYDHERGVFTLQLAKRLKNHCNIIVVCPLPWFPSWPFFPKLKKYKQYSNVPPNYNFEGIKVYSPKYLMFPKVSEKYHAFLMSVGIISCIRKLHRKYNFDFINSQWLYPDSVAVENIKIKLNIPHIATGLGCDINIAIYDGDKRKQLLKMLKTVDAVTVVSEALKNVLIKEASIPADKITAIPNGVDVTQFKSADMKECRKILNLNMNDEIILYVGRLSSEKGIDSLITAFSKLENRENLKLYIVGEGPLRKALSRQIDNYKLTERVKLVGKVDHSKISVWMGSCNYFSLPSLMEGCPNVVLEALGSGRPVIASNVGAIPDIVTNESGILFEPTNISDMVKSFNNALIKDWDYHAIAESVKSLSWEHAAERYVEVFKSTLHSG